MLYTKPLVKNAFHFLWTEITEVIFSMIKNALQQTRELFLRSIRQKENWWSKRGLYQCGSLVRIVCKDNFKNFFQMRMFFLTYVMAFLGQLHFTINYFFTTLLQSALRLLFLKKLWKCANTVSFRKYKRKGVLLVIYLLNHDSSKKSSIKRVSNTSVFLRNLRVFQEYLFSRTPVLLSGLPFLITYIYQRTHHVESTLIQWRYYIDTSKRKYQQTYKLFWHTFSM